jgi:hypothetical protein
VQAHTQPGDEVICSDTAHIYLYEGGGMARNSGMCHYCSLNLDTACKKAGEGGGCVFHSNFIGLKGAQGLIGLQCR